MPTKEDMETAYKKACKSLEGEKRAAIKKAKGTKGKKAKEAVAQVESEFEKKLKDLQDKFQFDVQALEGGPSTAVGNQDAPETTDGTSPEAANESGATAEKEKDPGESERERKLEKTRRKKQAKKEKEAQRQREIEEEDANAGPSRRQIEMEQIEGVLKPLNLKVSEVEADGHCLYRAVAAQTDKEYKEIRSLCAQTLAANQEEFSPFCEYSDTISSFDDYVEQVRNSAEWGGHLELRALGMALDRPILVYSVQSGSKPLGIHDERNDEDKKPIRLSYHLHYYALGEHYNEVVDT